MRPFKMMKSVSHTESLRSLLITFWGNLRNKHFKKAYSVDCKQICVPLIGRFNCGCDEYKVSAPTQCA